jgi:AraC-like DNA-binding protein
VLAGITVVLGAFPALAQMVRFEPTPAMATAISELAKISTEPFLSIRGFSEIKSGIEQLSRAHTERAADLLLIKRVPESLILMSPVREMVIIALMLGKWGIPAKKLAAICSCSLSKLDKTFQDAGLISPKDVLEWVLGLHAAWAIAVLGRSVTEAASDAGFTVGAFSKRITRHLGVTPSHLKHGRGFEMWLERFLAALHV